MVRPSAGLPFLLALVACDGGSAVISGSESTDPTAEFDIIPPDVDTARPVDDCALSDEDGDGYGEDCDRGKDCDDTNPDVNPGQLEIVYDGLDNDCNVNTRDDDLDKDGSPLAEDCNDDDANIGPTKPELCNNGVDDDCNPETIGEGEFGELVCPWNLGGADCNAILGANGEQAGLDGYYQTTNGAAWCDMTTDGGGWTLVLVSTDDGVDSFTFDAAGLLGSDATVVGTLGSFDADFKSWAWNKTRFHDLRFVHQPSGVDAIYAGAAAGTQNMGAFVLSKGAVDAPVCFDSTADPYPAAGIAMTGGSLAAGDGPDGRSLCSTDLYFNVGDHDLGSSECAAPTDPTGADQGYGPMWNTSDDCANPFVDAALGGIGPNAATSSVEGDSLGFAGALGLNTGTEAGSNQLWVYVR